MFKNIMIKYILILGLVGSANCDLVAQFLDESCAEATRRAGKDFRAGIMKATSYGLIVVADFEFEDFYDSYLLEKYGVDSQDGGCVIIESEECYSSRMFQLIKDKFGADFFKRTRIEAEELYSKPIKTFDDWDDPSTTAEVDNNGFYVIVDVQPQFPGGFEFLREYVDRKMIERQFPVDSNASRTYVAFVVDTLGRPKNIEIIKSSNAQLNPTLIDTLTGMPSWIPGLLHGNKVEVKVVLPFKY